jgi:2-amino-4-hydroxy-6-hydroxymethyldihydropteridine diphosphokinase
VTATVFIGFGSNMGDRLENIASALVRINRRPEFIMESLSSVYETEPVGMKNQPDFLNGAACFTTELSPMAVLQACLDAEKQGGRRRTRRWGPRAIDLDLLLYDSLQIATEELTVPHPELANRRFVLEPLVEIAPDATVPGLNKNTRRLLNETTDSSRVRFFMASDLLMNLINEV